ncbi:radical SAM protein [Klebsiella pneumoniae]|uniref:Radical SAM protein n=1 Tax=Klebsiella pneumoniae TaxID=573 RepID=A0A2X1QIA7_KLEPN|nr:radical SAM protein [Klebsiella pneumoniae]
MPHDDYVQHLLNDLQADAHYAQGREIGTIFIGGGTPSLLSGPAMQTLLDGVRACCRWPPGRKSPWKPTRVPWRPIASLIISAPG